jgi:hypothetical protein
MASILRTNFDATEYGGLSRFINHSCSSNSEVLLVRETVRLDRGLCFSSFPYGIHVLVCLESISSWNTCI